MHFHCCGEPVVAVGRSRERISGREHLGSRHRREHDPEVGPSRVMILNRDGPHLSALPGKVRESEAHITASCQPSTQRWLATRRRGTLPFVAKEGETLTRIVCVAAGLALALLATAVHAAPLRVGEAVPQSFTFMLLDLGAKQGIFANDGLSIEPSTFGGPVKQQQALAADGIDVALGVGLDLGFVAKGGPARAVAAMAGPPLNTCIIVLANSPLKSAADLKGKALGITSPTSILAWMVGEIAVRQGWERDAIRQVPAGTTTAQLSLLKAGQLNAAGSDLAPALQLERSGDVRILVRFGDVITDSLNNIILASDKLIAGRPDDLRAFLKGWFETIAYVRAHRAETIADMTEFLGIDRSFVEALYDRQMPMYSSDGRFSARGLALMARAIVDVHMLNAPPDVSRLYTEAFLPK